MPSHCDDVSSVNEYLYHVSIEHQCIKYCTLQLVYTYTTSFEMQDFVGTPDMTWYVGCTVLQLTSTDTLTHMCTCSDGLPSLEFVLWTI